MRIVTILSALTLASAAQAAPATCPPTHGGKALEQVTVFDGPPKDMASMRPEDGREVDRKLRQTWSIAEIIELGRQAHVECRYKGGASQIVKPPKSAKACVQDLLRLDDKGNYRLLSFSCR